MTLFTPYIVCIISMFFNDDIRNFLLINASVQLIIFFLTASLPSFFTGRMSYVDLAWPLGLFSIGLVLLSQNDLQKNPIFY